MWKEQKLQNTQVQRPLEIRYDNNTDMENTLNNRKTTRRDEIITYKIKQKRIKKGTEKRTEREE